MGDFPTNGRPVIVVIAFCALLGIALPVSEGFRCYQVVNAVRYKPFKGLPWFWRFWRYPPTVRRVCRCRICAVSPPSTSSRFSTRGGVTSQSPQPECSARRFTACPPSQYPPRSFSPRTSLLHLCALLSLCPPLPLASGTASFPWCSPFGVAFSVRTRPCLSDERPPLGCAVAVPGSVAPLPGGGARRRAVRNAPRDADAVRRWGSGVAVRRCLDVPVRAQRAARPCLTGSWRRVAGSRRTCRCWGCSRQRGGPPSPALGVGASPRVYVHRTLAPRSALGYDPCDRYDAGIRTNATRERVGGSDVRLVGQPSARSPPVTPR